jgi:hypothetical protein
MNAQPVPKTSLEEFNNIPEPILFPEADELVPSVRKLVVDATLELDNDGNIQRIYFDGPDTSQTTLYIDSPRPSTFHKVIQFFRRTFLSGDTAQCRLDFYNGRNGTEEDENIALVHRIQCREGSTTFFNATDQGAVVIGGVSPHAGASFSIQSNRSSVPWPTGTQNERDYGVDPVPDGTQLQTHSAGAAWFNTTANKLQVRVGNFWVDLH